MAIIRDDAGFSSEIFLFSDLTELKRQVDELISTSLENEILYVCDVREIIHILDDGTFDDDDDEEEEWRCLDDGETLEYLPSIGVYACSECNRYFFLEQLREICA